MMPDNEDDVEEDEEDERNYGQGGHQDGDDDEDDQEEVAVEVIESIDDQAAPLYMSVDELTSVAEAYAQEERKYARIHRSLTLPEGLGDQRMLELFVFLRPHPKRW